MTDAEEESAREAETAIRIHKSALQIAEYVGIRKDPELTILVGNIYRVVYEERRQAVDEYKALVHKHKCSRIAPFHNPHADQSPCVCNCGAKLAGTTWL